MLSFTEDRELEETGGSVLLDDEDEDFDELLDDEDEDFDELLDDDVSGTTEMADGDGIGGGHQSGAAASVELDVVDEELPAGSPGFMSGLGGFRRIVELSGQSKDLIVRSGTE